MPERTFGAESLVQLPRLNANGAIALGTEIETALKKAKKVPAPIKKVASRLAKAHKALRTGVAGRLTDPADPGSAAGRKADQILDGAWRATHDWGSGWAGLPLAENEALAEKGQKLVDVLYGDGLKFIQLSWKLEHSESQARLDRIAKDGLSEVFEALGGGVFLKTLRKAHAGYGKALGLTEAKPKKEPPADLRALLDEFYATLRVFVLRVSAHADEDEPATVKLSDALLAPVVAADSLGRGPAPATEGSADEPTEENGSPPPG